MNKKRRWTEEEDVILKECYINRDLECERSCNEAFERLERRSKAAIRSRAHMLGYTDKNGRNRDMHGEWGLFNRIRNMLREVKGLPPVPFSENPFEDGKVGCENEV